MSWDPLLLDGTLSALAALIMFYLSLLALLAVAVLVPLFGGVLIQYTFRLIRRKFSEGKI
jgi:hypothetical protein